MNLDRPVTIHAAGVSAEQVLSDILAAAWAAGDEAGEPAGLQIGAEVDRYGVLVVAAGLPVGGDGRRCYNLRLIVARPSKAWPVDAPTEDRVAVVSDWLVKNVDADSSRDMGGSVGGMKYLAPVLVVTQTPDAHERIAAALRDWPWDRAVQPAGGRWGGRRTRESTRRRGRPGSR